MLGMLQGTLRAFKTQVAQPTKSVPPHFLTLSTPTDSTRVWPRLQELKMQEISERLQVQAAKDREEAQAAKAQLYETKNATQYELRRLAQLKDFKLNV
jgi:hypothetical protein